MSRQLNISQAVNTYSNNFWQSTGDWAHAKTQGERPNV